MKKIAIISFLIVVIAAIYVFKQSSELTTGSGAGAKQSESGANSAEVKLDSQSQKERIFETISEGKRNERLDEEVKPAIDLYSNADEAINSILKGAKDYDDLILEQFAQMPKNCSWCADFYARVNEMMLAEKDEDTKSYLAEVLSISGSVENAATLINAIKNSGNDVDADIYAEALEIAMGDNDLVSFLSNNLDTDNELLKESVLAALTNHGSREAIESIYDFTVKSGDPDGFYSLGIGLGEIIPDETSYPLLRQLAEKRDSYSHLAIKALLNSGDQGLKEVVNIISSSPQDDTTRQLLNDAVDHVAYDEDTEAYLQELRKNSSNPLVKEFVENIMDELELESSDTEDY